MRTTKHGSGRHRARSRRRRLRPVLVLVILACGAGLSASALERPGGYFISTPASAPTTVVTRVVYAGPMPPALAPAVVVASAWTPKILEPFAEAAPTSLPRIPDFELISDTKVATLRGRPISADPLLEAGAVPGGPQKPLFMTILPSPARSAAVPGVPQLFCDGHC